MRKLILTILFCFICSVAFGAADWSLLDENMSDITDWSDSSTGTGTATQTTFDSQETVKLDSGGTATNPTYARIYQDIGTIPDNFTVEIKVYHETLDGDNFDSFSVIIDNGVITFYVILSLNGITVVTNSGGGEVGTDEVLEDTWQTWRFLVTGGDSSATCDVYLDDSLIESDVDCAVTLFPYSDGDTFLDQNGVTTANRISYVDYIKVDDGLHTPDSPASGWGGKIYGISSPANVNGVETIANINGVE